MEKHESSKYDYKEGHKLFNIQGGNTPESVVLTTATPFGLEPNKHSFSASYQKKQVFFYLCRQAGKKPCHIGLLRNKAPIFIMSTDAFQGTSGFQCSRHASMQSHNKLCLLRRLHFICKVHLEQSKIFAKLEAGRRVNYFFLFPHFSLSHHSPTCKEITPH